MYTMCSMLLLLLLICSVENLNGLSTSLRTGPVFHRSMISIPSTEYIHRMYKLQAVSDHRKSSSSSSSSSSSRNETDFVNEVLDDLSKNTTTTNDVMIATESNRKGLIGKVQWTAQRVGKGIGYGFSYSKQKLIALILFTLQVLRFDNTKNSMKETRRNTSMTSNSNNNKNNRPNRMQQILGKMKNILKENLKPKVLLRFMLIAMTGSIYLEYMMRRKKLIKEIPYSLFLSLLSSSPQRIQRLQIGPDINIPYIFELDGKKALTRPVQIDSNLLNELLSKGIDFYARPAPLNVVGILGTACYAFFLWRITSRMLQGPKDEGAGKSRDKMNLEAYGKLSFDDVAGQEAAKLEVKEICDMLKNPMKYIRAGARLPSGVLLSGPPGSGKTLLARVMAAEAQVPFYACSASDFVEVYVGRGPARVRNLFKQAGKDAPCILFIDEIDSIGRSRRMGTLNSEQETTLNQLLTSMDGLDTSNNGVIVVAATNRLELLDNALLRSGRFDRLVQCPLPDRIGRYEILKVHSKNLKLGSDVDLDRISRLTPGTSGADLSGLANEAAIRAVRNGREEVYAQDWDDALQNFYSSRGVSLPNLAEVANSNMGNIMPSWMQKLLKSSNNSKDFDIKPAISG